MLNISKSLYRKSKLLKGEMQVQTSYVPFITKEKEPDLNLRSHLYNKQYLKKLY